MRDLSINELALVSGGGIADLFDDWVATATPAPAPAPAPEPAPEPHKPLLSVNWGFLINPRIRFSIG